MKSTRDQDSPGGTTTKRAVLFADVVNSVQLYERYGNRAAKEMITSCLEARALAVEARGGVVKKLLGDGILCTFHSPVEAVLASEPSDSPIQTRIGIHFGDVIEEEGDVFGDTVNVASRLSSLARPSEVLISRAVREDLPPHLAELVRPVPHVPIKGKHRPFETFTVSWEDALEASNLDQAGRTICIQPGNWELGARRLRLIHDRCELVLEADAEITVGRGRDNDLVVSNQHASRLHARISHRSGKFVLLDQSANGTYVCPDGQRLHLMREEVILHGRGAIYLGADPQTTSSEPILYETT